MHVVEPQLAPLYPRVPLPQVHPARADGLDLGASERDPNLEGLEDLVLMQRPPVVGVEPLALAGRGRHVRSAPIVRPPTARPSRGWQRPHPARRLHSRLLASRRRAAAAQWGLRASRSPIAAARN